MLFGNIRAISDSIPLLWALVSCSFAAFIRSPYFMLISSYILLRVTVFAWSPFVLISYSLITWCELSVTTLVSS